MLFSLLGLFESHKSNFNINIGFLGTMVAIFLASYRLKEKKFISNSNKKNNPKWLTMKQMYGLLTNHWLDGGIYVNEGSGIQSKAKILQIIRFIISQRCVSKLENDCSWQTYYQLLDFSTFLSMDPHNIHPINTISSKQTCFKITCQNRFLPVNLINPAN